MTLYDQYIDQVSSGEIITGELIQLAVQRHLSDMDKSQDDSYPYIFDRDKADRIIKIAHLHRHTKGREYKGKLFDVQPFQAFLLASLYGWVNRETGYRRFTTIYFEVARKAAKSELAALICNIMAVWDQEQSAEVYTVATKRDQAMEVFKAAKKMSEYLRQDYNTLKDIIQIYRDSVFVTSTDSVIKALSSDYNSMDGMSVHCGIIDEYHSHKTDSLLEIIRSSQGMLVQPLSMVITTAGWNIQSPCYELHEYCADVLRGVIEDDRTLALIYNLDDPETEWEQEEMWIKSNPMIGITPKWDFMRSEYKTAKQRGGTKLASFKTKNLNMWLSSSSEWIPDQYVQDSYDDEITEASLIGRSCIAALDLASDYDISALVLLFPPEDEGEKYKCLRYYFIPDENARERSERDRVNYLRWIEEGYMITTPGDVTDYNYIRQHILRLSSMYHIDCIGYDAWNSSQLVSDLVSDGHNVHKQSLTVAALNAATEEMGRLYRGRMISSPTDPVYRWMMLNVELEYGYNDNKRPKKNARGEKIDGVISELISIATLLNKDKWNKMTYGTGVYIG